MGLHSRANELYKTDNIHLDTDDRPSTVEVELAFDSAIKWLHSKGEFGSDMITEEPVLDLINKTTEYIAKGIEKGVGIGKPSELLINKLRENVGVFSGFKTFHEMKEAANMLIDKDGNIKPFERYSKDVLTLNNTYNRNYLKTEYDFAVASSEMAARWEDFIDDDNGRYLLQYRTMEDDSVRNSHQKLNGVTLHASDSFWDSYYPPNGWGCRCTVVKVRAKNNPESISEQAITAGAEATAGKYSDMFRFNPGKEQKVFPSHNSYTISKCSTCPKGGLSLAKIPSNELCAACQKIKDVQSNRNNNKLTHNETKVIRKEMLKWANDNLGDEIINGENAKRTYIKTSDNHEIIIGKVFFNETFAKNIKNPLLPKIAETSILFEEWIQTAELVRIEEGRHHDFKFSVYSTTYGNNHIEFKCKMTEGEILYNMVLK